MAESLGKRLMRLRKENGMTQKQLAEKSGIALASISVYENDVADPSLFKAFCLAETLGVTLDYLVGKSEYKTVQEAFNAIQRANAAKAESETMNNR